MVAAGIFPHHAYLWFTYNTGLANLRSSTEATP
jgi:hypothetical protein